MSRKKKTGVLGVKWTDMKTTMTSFLQAGMILSAAFGFHYLTPDQQDALIKAGGLMYAGLTAMHGWFSKDK